MRGETALSLVLVALFKRKRSWLVGIESELIDLVRKVEAYHIPIHGLPRKPTPRGLTFEPGPLSRFQNHGYIVEGSYPYRLTPEGLTLILQIIREASAGAEADDVRRTMAVLRLSAEDLCEEALV